MDRSASPVCSARAPTCRGEAGAEEGEEEGPTQPTTRCAPLASALAIGLCAPLTICASHEYAHCGCTCLLRLCLLGPYLLYYGRTYSIMTVLTVATLTVQVRSFGQLYTILKRDLQACLSKFSRAIVSSAIVSTPSLKLPPSSCYHPAGARWWRSVAATADQVVDRAQTLTTPAPTSTPTPTPTPGLNLHPNPNQVADRGGGGADGARGRRRGRVEARAGVVVVSRVIRVAIEVDALNQKVVEPCGGWRR